MLDFVRFRIRLKQHQGGVRIQTPSPLQTPPPSRPPKVFEPVLLQFAISRKSAGAEGAEKNFGLLREGGLPYVSILKMLRILWRIQKWMKTKKYLTPDLTSGSDLGRWQPS